MADLKYTDYIRFGRNVTMTAMHKFAFNRLVQSREHPDNDLAAYVAMSQVSEYAKAAGATWDEAMAAIRSGKILRRKA